MVLWWPRRPYVYLTPSSRALLRNALRSMGAVFRTGRRAAAYACMCEKDACGHSIQCQLWKLL